MMQQTTDNKSVNKLGLIFSLLGGLAVLIVCGMIAGGIFLDVFGEETTGTMTNISFDASRSDNPFTPQVTFTTADGKETSFIPWQDRAYFELDERIRRSADNSRGPSQVDVRYLENNPKFAKVSFVYHIEYVNRAIWIFWSGVVFLIGLITNRRGKMPVPDLSKRNQ